LRLQPENTINKARKCIIATGSNLKGSLKGDQSPLDAALRLMSSESLEIIDQSPWYKSHAFPAGSGPDFTNGAVLCKTTLNASELIAHLHSVEHELGRNREKRWGPRVIDLDLIDFDGQIEPSLSIYKHWESLELKKQMQETPEQLILPHPRLQDRVFVMVPMRDIVPDWVHPVSGQSLDQLLSRFTQAELAQIWRA
jgi:2-amino-4-hydroxy-6-hydroxymethyldihydropteridine diphosphokinase